MQHYVFIRYQISNWNAYIKWLIFIACFSIDNSIDICCGRIVRRMWWNIGCESIDDINCWPGLQCSRYNFKFIRLGTKLHWTTEWHRQQCIHNGCSSGAIHCRNSNAACKIFHFVHFHTRNLNQSNIFQSKQAYLSEWRLVFWITFALHISKTIIFTIWGSAKIQPWNENNNHRKWPKNHSSIIKIHSWNQSISWAN